MNHLQREYHRFDPTESDGDLMLAQFFTEVVKLFDNPHARSFQYQDRVSKQGQLQEYGVGTTVKYIIIDIPPSRYSVTGVHDQICVARTDNRNIGTDATQWTFSENNGQITPLNDIPSQEIVVVRFSQTLQEEACGSGTIIRVARSPSSHGRSVLAGNLRLTVPSFPTQWREGSAQLMDTSFYQKRLQETRLSGADIITLIEDMGKGIPNPQMIEKIMTYMVRYNGVVELGKTEPTNSTSLTHLLQ